jgi:hypothetical protein
MSSSAARSWSISPVALQERVLHIKPDISIDIGSIEDSCEGVVSHDLVTHGVRGYT